MSFTTIKDMPKQKCTDTTECVQCNKAFRVGGRDGKKRGTTFCSTKCVGKHQQRKRICIVCANEFVRQNRAQPKCCSEACFKKATGRRVLKWWEANPEAHGQPQMHTCRWCKKPFGVEKDATRSPKFCSTTCRDKGNTGPLSSSWKGGRYIKGDGYVVIYAPDFSKPMKNNMAMEHRVVMERHLGRPIEAHETVHHINGARGDNRLENLQLRSGRHGKGAVYECFDCKSTNVRPKKLS